MMFNFNLHHITLILIGYLSNISCSPLPFGLLSSQVSGNGITFSHVELPNCPKVWVIQTMLMPCEEGFAVHHIFFLERVMVVLKTTTITLLKEKLPQAFMQIGWKEDDFRNITAKVWANLDNPIKRYDFSKVSLILCMSPSQVALF